MGSAKRIDTANRMIEASAETVYAAFADPVAWEQWLPPTGMTGHVQEFDFREGGRYRLTLHYADEPGAGKTTTDEDVSQGTFIKLVPNELVVQRIVFESDDPTFAGTMLMTWKLEPVARATRVTMTAENVPSGISPEDHQAGLRSTLDNLAAFVRP